MILILVAGLALVASATASAATTARCTSLSHASHLTITAPARVRVNEVAISGRPPGRMVTRCQLAEVVAADTEPERPP